MGKRSAASMASDPPNGGLNADLKAKQDAKYDAGLEKAVVEWIEDITELSMERLCASSVADWLKDGTVLCELANKVRPGSMKTVNLSTMPEQQMENITNFMNAARDMGVPESAMFGTSDLDEENIMGSVISCIYTFGGVVHVTRPEFTGPKLGHIPISVTFRMREDAVDLHGTLRALEASLLAQLLAQKRAWQHTSTALDSFDGAVRIAK